MEGVLFDVEEGVRFVITAKTVRGGEAVKQSVAQRKAPLNAHLLSAVPSQEVVINDGNPTEDGEPRDSLAYPEGCGFVLRDRRS